jgi:hypothetical protein
MRRSIDIIILIILAFVGYHFRDEIQRGALIIAERTGIIAPCSRPITYSLGIFDSRFGITKDAFLGHISDAEQIWETASDRNLFEYKDQGGLPINLVYDYRQQSTEKLNDLGDTIDSAKARYDRLRSQYLTLKAQVTADQAAFNTKVKSFEKRQGRISEAQLAEIKLEQNALNKEIDILNSLVKQINTLAKELNITVDSYNTVSISAGESFDEGEYIYDTTGERINIYQYSNGTKLDRVLAHELGHALNLDHVNNDESIMYYLNSGKSFELTAEDVSELMRVCKL